MSVSRSTSEFLDAGPSGTTMYYEKWHMLKDQLFDVDLLSRGVALQRVLVVSQLNALPIIALTMSVVDAMQSV